MATQDVKVTNLLAAAGGKLIDGTTAVIPVSGTTFFNAIAVIAEAVVASMPGNITNEDGSSNDPFAGKTLAANTVFYGQWSSVRLTSGSVIAYNG